MNRITLSLAVLAVFSFSFGKPLEFEGAVHYTHNFVSLGKWDYIIEPIYGTGSTYRYSAHGFRLDAENSMSPTLFYNTTDTFIYYQDSPDTLTAESARISGSEIVTTNIADTSVIILGHACKRFLIITKNKKSGTRFKKIYYFSNDFPLNPAIFQNCHDRNFDAIFASIKAVPLRMDWEAPGKYRVEMTADKIEPGTVADSVLFPSKNAYIKQQE
jgi:hypothetical protein